MISLKSNGLPERCLLASLQNSFDTVFVLAGDGDGLAADGNDIRRGKRGIGHIDQEGAVDAEESGPQEVLPLTDAGAVAVGPSIACKDPHLGIA